MEKEPRDGGSESSEHNSEDVLLPMIPSVRNPTASLQANRSAGMQEAVLDFSFQRGAYGAETGAGWFLHNAGLPTTPVSYLLAQDEPSTPLPYADSWTAPSTTTLGVPGYADQSSRWTSHNQNFPEGQDMSATVSSYIDPFNIFSSMPMDSRPYFSSAEPSYVQRSPSPSFDINRTQHQEQRKISPVTSASMPGVDFKKNRSSPRVAMLQDVPHPSLAFPMVSGAYSPGSADVQYSLQAVTASSMSSSSSEGAENIDQVDRVNEKDEVAESAAADVSETQDEKPCASKVVEETATKERASEEQDDSSMEKQPSPDSTRTQPAGKTKKKGQKRHREARVAFITKSEVEHLEDGFRWRKYGQKAVKNSPYPSYYRCTSSKCFVKKRVERSPQDGSLVITTYEGQHNHHSPAVMRGSVTDSLHHNVPGLYAALAAAAAAAAAGAASAGPSSSFQMGSFSDLPARHSADLLPFTDSFIPPLHPPFPSPEPMSELAGRSRYELAMQLGSRQDMAVSHCNLQSSAVETSAISLTPSYLTTQEIPFAFSTPSRYVMTPSSRKPSPA
ncbi:hypothetical protein KP509_04G004900 [Ceratopteris richardii]|uniref:WRKY domain-containing protein n=1 Tax=Ceratopteris richardii TaxID=49495 RepID=A0A8T2UPZ0_CERRI|nr:hypothetical protein KP509_04G004900 [Ceratopteris richardii]